MNPEAETWSLMDRYWQGEMTPEERTRFEQRLEAEPEFKARAQAYAQARMSIRQEARDALAGKVKAEYEAYLQQSTSGKSLPFFRRYWWVAAAAMILLLAWPLKNLLYPGHADPAGLYEAYYATPVFADRDGLDDGDTLVTRAMQAYNRKEFGTAARDFASLLENSPSSQARKGEFSFYLGIAYLELDQADQALASFAQISPESMLWFPEGEWFAALAQLRLGQTTAALSRLRDISQQPRHKYRQQASELISQLE